MDEKISALSLIGSIDGDNAIAIVEDLTGSPTTKRMPVRDEDNMISDDPKALATQQSIKAYIDAGKYIWLGAWVTATGYDVNDLVQNDGSGYVCIQAHTSGATTEPGTGANWADYWDLVVQGMEVDITSAWSTWSPTVTGLTLGNGTLIARYKQIGKTILLVMKLIFGNTTSVTGNWGTFTLPVNSNSNYTALRNNLGGVYILDSGTAEFTGFARVESSTQGRPLLTTTGSTYAGVATLTATAPMTWTTNDLLAVEMNYESA